MNPAFKTCSTAVALALAAALAPTSANAQAAASHASASARSEHSAAAIKLLASVADARAALARHDRTAAMNHVNAALGRLPRLEGMALVPVYSEMSSDTVIGPIAAAKKGSNAPVAVRAVASGYSAVLLDTKVARTQLAAARSALASGNLKAADTDLRLVQQGVVLEQVAARLPLVKARENLALATTDARRGNWKGARGQLNAAARALDDYGKIAPAAQSSDVRSLEQQISAYASANARLPAGAAAHIDGWWDRVAEMTDMRG